jgi:hypothetical protein
MKTNQAWGWLAAGVLAAGLNASYYDGGIQWAHRIADRVGQHSEAVLARATGQADQFLAEARLITVRNEPASCPWTTAVARAQSRIARAQRRFDGFQVMSTREEAQRTSLEANRARMEARIAAHTARFPIAQAALAQIYINALPAPVVCPRVRVNIHKLPMAQMPVIPGIHVEVAGTGPV